MVNSQTIAVHEKKPGWNANVPLWLSFDLKAEEVLKVDVVTFSSVKEVHCVFDKI